MVTDRIDANLWPAPQPACDRDRTSGGLPACPACGGKLMEQRAKLLCSSCHRICETCCEGGRE